MAVNDYKSLKFQLTRDGEFVVEKDDVVEAFKSYLKRLARGDKDLKLVVGVNLKRRQNLESYKKQLAKGIKANKATLNQYSKKLGLNLVSDFDEVITSVMLGMSKTDNSFSVRGCDNSFLLIVSDVILTV